MANIGITELKGVLQRAGIPIPTFDPEKLSSIERENAITGQIQREQSPIVEKAKKDYMRQIDQIAQMDQRLAGVYNNPASQLYIEHPLQVENIRSGAANIGYGAANALGQRIGRAQESIDQNAQDIVSFYNSILETKLGTNVDELGELASILPGMDFGSIEDILSQSFNEEDLRPDISSFDDEKPPMSSFDTQDISTDILNQPYG